MDKIRTIKLFKNYYKEFYVAQTKTVRDKINTKEDAENAYEGDQTGGSY